MGVLLQSYNSETGTLQQPIELVEAQMDEMISDPDIAINNEQMIVSWIANDAVQYQGYNSNAEPLDITGSYSLGGVESVVSSHRIEMDNEGRFVMVGTSFTFPEQMVRVTYWLQQFNRFGQPEGDYELLDEITSFDFPQNTNFQSTLTIGQDINRTLSAFENSEGDAFFLIDTKDAVTGVNFDREIISADNDFTQISYPGVAYIDPQHVVVSWEENMDAIRSVWQRVYELPTQPEIIVEETHDSTFVPEGGYDSIYVSLPTQPLEQVVIGIAALVEEGQEDELVFFNADGDEIDSLVFNTDYSPEEQQLVVLHKENDSRITGPSEQRLEFMPINTDDPNYTDEIMTSLTVMIGENDTAGVILSGPEFVLEGDTAQFEIALRTIPASRICMNFNTVMDDNGRPLELFSREESEVCFDADSSALDTQVVELYAIDDEIDYGDTLAVSLEARLSGEVETEFYTSDDLYTLAFHYLDNDQQGVEFEYIPQYAREGGDQVMVVAILLTKPHIPTSLELEGVANLQVVFPEEGELTFGPESERIDTFYVRALQRDEDPSPGYYQGQLEYNFSALVEGGVTFP